MSKKTSYLFGILLTILFGTALYCYLCDDCNCGAAFGSDSNQKNTIVDTPDSTVKKATYNAFKVDGDFDVSAKDNFNFNLSNYSALLPLSENVDAAIAKVKDYLSNNPTKSVGITGYYTSNETNNSAYPNLGLARANSVKNYLVLKGIPSKNIELFGELNNEIYPDTSNVLFGPVAFNVKDSNTSKDDLKILADKIKANPLVLYFNTGQASINLTAEQRQKIADISKYLDKVDGASCNVVGHTDNTGNRAINIKLGQDRADFGKTYLVKNGIPDSKINTSSKGPDEPIADNTTEEGRAKNRRTVITIN